MAHSVVLLIEMLKSNGSGKTSNGILACAVSPIMVLAAGERGLTHEAFKVKPVRSNNPRLIDEPGFSPMEKDRKVTFVGGIRETVMAKPLNWMEAKASEMGWGKKELK